MNSLSGSKQPSLEDPFFAQIASPEVKNLATRLFGCCNEEDPNTEQLLDEAQFLGEYFQKQAEASSDEDDVPFQFLAFAAQTTIVFFSWDRIPKLLDLLTEMDMARQRISERAQERLLMYEVGRHQHPDSYRELDDGEQEELKWWANPAIAFDIRKEYHHLSLQLRENHIVRCLANRDPEEYERLRTLYFPQDYSASHEVYHQNLTDAEIAKELHRAEAIDIRDVWEEWEADRTGWLKEHFPNISDELLYGNAEYLSYKDAFGKRFLDANTVSNLVQNQVRNWIRRVERHLEVLEGFYDVGGLRVPAAAAHAASTTGSTVRKKRRKTGSIASRQKRPRYSIADILPNSRRTSSVTGVKTEPEDS